MLYMNTQDQVRILGISGSLRKASFSTAILSTLARKAAPLMLMAVAQTHVPEPPANLGDTSFFDGVAGPGIVAEEIGDDAYSSEIVDAKGHEVPGTGAGRQHQLVDAYCMAQPISCWWWLVRRRGRCSRSPCKWRTRFDGWRLGDMTISPLILQWNEKKLGSVAFEPKSSIRPRSAGW
jgi:hypothetical protein